MRLNILPQFLFHLTYGVTRQCDPFRNLGCLLRLMVFCVLLCVLDYNWYKNGPKHTNCLDIMLSSKYNPVDVELTVKLCVY